MKKASKGLHVYVVAVVSPPIQLAILKVMIQQPVDGLYVSWVCVLCQLLFDTHCSVPSSSRSPMRPAHVLLVTSIFKYCWPFSSSICCAVHPGHSAVVGVVVGVAVGVRVGVAVGVAVEVLVGLAVGVLVGVLVGVNVGVIVGVCVGECVGVCVGVIVAVAVGVFVGVAVGVAVGVCVGPFVGVFVGV